MTSAHPDYWPIPTQRAWATVVTNAAYLFAAMALAWLASTHEYPVSDAQWHGAAALAALGISSFLYHWTGALWARYADMACTWWVLGTVIATPILALAEVPFVWLFGNLACAGLLLYYLIGHATGLYYSRRWGLWSGRSMPWAGGTALLALIGLGWFSGWPSVPMGLLGLALVSALVAAMSRYASEQEYDASIKLAAETRLAEYRAADADGDGATGALLYLDVLSLREMPPDVEARVPRGATWADVLHGTWHVFTSSAAALSIIAAALMAAEILSR